MARPASPKTPVERPAPPPRTEMRRRPDIYALGVTLYEALSGVFPHEDEGLAGLFVKKVTTDPLPLRARAPKVSTALEAVIMRAISRDKANRQNDARAFRQELRDVLASLR